MPSQETYNVWLHDRVIAWLTRRGDVTRFRFTDDYIADPRRAILGLRFEDDLRVGLKSHLRLPPWFSNLLPEGLLRERIAAQRGVSMKREMELLIEVGHDLPGAVRVIATDTVVKQNEDSREVTVPQPPATGDARWRFSLAGIALKLSMLADGDRLVIPAVAGSGDWIVKLPDPRFALVPINEHAMMTLAGRCGIEVPEIRLVAREALEGTPDSVWRSAETMAYAVRRFDRAGDRSLIHIEDFAQVRGFYPDEKYHGNYETLAALIYRRKHLDDLREFVRRLTFNLLIANSDAHLKNWSLIYRNPRVPRLSPAYDLVSTAMYAEDQAEHLGLKFDGRRQIERIGPSNFRALERRLKVPTTLTDDVREVVERAVAQWPEVARDLDIPADMRSNISNAIDAGARRLGRAVGREFSGC